VDYSGKSLYCVRMARGKQPSQVSLWRRRLASRAAGRRGGLRGWFQRHPLILIFISVAAMSGLVLAEASWIAQARHTVPRGWGAGLAAGIAASLGLTALFIVVTWAARREPGRAAIALSVIGLVIVVSFFVAWRGTAPHNSAPGQAPYVITSWVSVAGMAYAGTIATQILALLIWAAVWYLRGGRRRGQSSPR
jgi:hypothetical protein